MATATATNSKLDLKALLRQVSGVPLGVLVMLAMMMLPVPPFALDVLFTFNIALSIVIVLLGVSTPRARWISACSRPSCCWRRCCGWR